VLRLTAHPWLRRGITIALTLVAVASMVALLYANWDTLRAFEWHIRPFPLVLSFLAYSLALAFAILAWGGIMSNLGTSVPWREHIRVYCVSNLARRLPGVLWHVVGRIALYDHAKAGPAAVSVGSALELVLMALSGIALAVMTWPTMAAERLHPAWIVGGLVLGLTLIHPRVLHIPLQWVQAPKEADLGPRLQYRQVFGWLLLYGGSWLAGGMVVYALIAAIYPVSLAQLPQIIGAWSLSGMVSVVAVFLPVGLGLRELALGLLLSTFLPDGLGILVAVIIRLLLTLYEVLWALLAQAQSKVLFH
jgi:uncharacterized membrane protein YbhN (UPF0104 family)